MKIAMILVSLSFIFVPAITVFSHEQHKNIDEVEQILKKNAEAFSKSDIAALDQLWANDESVVVFENGHPNYGWTDYRNNHLIPEMEELKNVQYEISNVKAHKDTQTAWATFTYTIAADLPDKRVEGQGVGTAVFSRQNDRWRIVHWHTSSPRKPAAAERKK